MKNKSVYPIVILLIAGGLLITSHVFSGSRNFAPERHANLIFFFTAFGKLIATVGGIWLLIRAVAGASLAELVPLTLPVIAGVMIAGFHWSGAVALAVIGLGVLSQELLGDKGRAREPRNRGDAGRRRGAGDRKQPNSNPGRDEGARGK